MCPILASLHTADELELTVDKVVGEDYEVCVSNLPRPLPLNRTRLKLRFTVPGSKPEDVQTPTGSLTAVTPTKICYTLTKEAITQTLSADRASIQVALLLEDVLGPYIPDLPNAPEIEVGKRTTNTTND